MVKYAERGGCLGDLIFEHLPYDLHAFDTGNRFATQIVLKVQSSFSFSITNQEMNNSTYQSEISESC